jgi:UDP-N-acetyl-2-amino-2-deoxyglucuronate dehydrogenase
MPLKLALIGCGGIASARHLPGYATIKQKEADLFDLVAVCDADQGRAEAAAKFASDFQSTPPRIYTDVTQLLQNEKLDAVDICTPHFLHHTVGIQCMEAGVPVQIEKPVGVSAKATQQLIAASKRTGKLLATAENIRRMPGPRTAHWLFHERGDLGPPIALYSQRVQARRPSAAHGTAGGGTDDHPQWVWRNDVSMSGGGPVMDSGAHFCDTIRYLYGDVESCYGRVWQVNERHAWKNDDLVRIETEDTFIATINFESGATGTWSVSSQLPGQQFSNVVYYGAEGSIVEANDPFHGPRITAQVVLKDGTTRPLEEYYKEYLEALGEKGRQRVFPHGIEDGFALEIYDFLTSVRDGRPPEIDGDQGLRAKAIALAIYESNATGQAVRVKDVLDGTVNTYQRPINEKWSI